MLRDLSTAAAITLLLSAGAFAADPVGNATPRNAIAWLQRDGKPYNAFYSYYITPHAVLEAGRVFCAFQDGEGRPIAMAYDIKSESWTGPVRASDHGLGADTHGNPSICVDAKGHVHLFFGCHGRRMWHVRSLQPHDITEWGKPDYPTDRATYPETIRLADGRMLLFYRAGGHMEPWSLRISSDDGATWSDPERVIEMRLDPPDRLAAAYSTIVPGARYETVHCFFLHKDDNPTRREPHPWRPLKYPGLHEAVYRYNVYYIRREADGTWTGADGAKMSLPISKAQADRHAKVHDTGDEFASHRRIVIDEKNTPYLRFAEGVSDWKSGKVIVPLETRYAWRAASGWKVSDSLPASCSEEVKKHLAAPGPAAYGGPSPNPWFIHHAAGPRGGGRATYVWLGHIDRGYIPFPGGPARCPE